MLTQPQPAPVQTSKPGYRETTVLLVLDYVVRGPYSAQWHSPTFFVCVLQVQQSHRMVVFVVIFILMTLLFLYGSNNSSSEAYIPIHVAVNRFLINTDLKKWAGKEGYMPLHRNKVRTEFTGRRERNVTGLERFHWLLGRKFSFWEWTKWVILGPVKKF